MFILDAHLDLSMNALEWNRDLRQPIESIRAREKEMTDKPDRGLSTVCFPEMQKGRVGCCVATLIARHVKPGNPLPGWHSPEQAWAQTQGQWAWYREMERQGYLKNLRTSAEFKAHLDAWQPGQAIGYVLSLEGADSILEPELLERSYAQGLRAVGPAHYGPGTYAPGTGTTGPLSAKGRELLAEMDRLGMILDVTHLSDESFWEALDLYEGPVWASHSNSRVLVPDQRQLSDEQLHALIARGAVIGTALDAWMLVPDWKRGQSHPSNTEVLLRHVADHIEHVCTLAGSARYSGLGTDLDGGFGREQGPSDVRTIADLQLLSGLLSERGFTPEDISGVLHGNFSRFLLEALP